ncbi:MAG: glycosyltransferase family 2 protein, partial [Armatimonadota bacterium]
MKTTVLIPSYKRGPALLHSLAGVINGERVPDQVVVVLRDTDEESQELVQNWLDECSCPDVFDIPQVSEPGQIAAINRGLEVASGDIVAFTDDDAVPRSQWLKCLVSHYEDPDVGGVGGRDVVHHGDTITDGETTVVGRITAFGRIIGNHHLELQGPAAEVEHLKGVNMSFRRELIQPFDPNIQGPHFNDTDQSLSVRKQGW